MGIILTYGFSLREFRKKGESGFRKISQTIREVRNGKGGGGTMGREGFSPYVLGKIVFKGFQKKLGGSG